MRRGRRSSRSSRRGRMHKSGVQAAEAALEQARRKAMERIQAEGVDAVA